MVFGVRSREGRENEAPACFCVFVCFEKTRELFYFLNLFLQSLMILEILLKLLFRNVSLPLVKPFGDLMILDRYSFMLFLPHDLIQRS